jgi:hypothetical protein
MQINPNSSPAPVAGADTASKTVKRAATESDSGAFSHVDALEKSMRDPEDVRTDVVKKAAALANQSQWPPTETIRQIANMMAITMEKNYYY